MNMHEAVWATCRWHVWLVLRHKQPRNVFFPLCSSEEQGRELEKMRTLLGTSPFPQQGWITSTLMKQTRIQRSTKPMRAVDASVHPQDTPTRRTIHLKNLYANTFSLQTFFSPLKLNALISFPRFLLTGALARYEHLCICHTLNAPYRVWYFSSGWSLYVKRHCQANCLSGVQSCLTDTIRHSPLTQNQLIKTQGFSFILIWATEARFIQPHGILLRGHQDLW